MNQEELEKKYGISLDKKDIRKRTIRDMVLLLIAGSIYYLLIIHTPFSLRCYLYELFHKMPILRSDQNVCFYDTF